MAGLAGLRAAGLHYDPSTFSSFTNQYRAPGAYQAGTFSTQNVNAPQLQQFQMGPYERVEGQEAFSADAAKQYMNPYMQNVVDIQKREAQRQADIAAGQRAGQAAQAGAFGGSRMGLQSAMADRETQRLMQDIQATGSSSAYQQAQGQFNLEQQARRQAALANQAAGLTTGQANLQALLGVQQLGSGQSMQAQLANQQALMQAQQAAEQSRQFGYGQGMTAAEAAARYGLEAQRGTLSAQQAAEQSRQFGAGYGLQGIQQQLAAAGQLGQLGQTQFGQQKDILQGQLAAGAQQRDLEQQRLTQAYQDFQNQRQYPYQQLAFLADMTRGLPLAQYSQTMYAQPASPYAQLAGAGMTYLGAKQAGLFGAEGGVVPGGLAQVAANKLSQG